MNTRIKLHKYTDTHNLTFRYPDVRGKLVSHHDGGDGSPSRPTSLDGRLGETSPPIIGHIAEVPD